jgi:hypothetical protein
MTRTRFAIWSGDGYVADPGADSGIIEFTSSIHRALKFVTPERASTVAQSILERMSLPLSVVAIDLEY